MQKKGFTLIELLVVIAIIGILATVVLVNMSTGRTKANASKALQSLKSAQSAAILCRDSGVKLYRFKEGTTSGTSNQMPIAGEKMCSGGAAWPDISSTGWNYNTGSGSAMPVSPNDPAVPSTITGSTTYLYIGGADDKFNYGASGGSGMFIQCTNVVCGKVGF